MPDTSTTILVTGAIGFIAAHIIQRLLRQGDRVRGPVRSILSLTFGMVDVRDAADAHVRARIRRLQAAEDRARLGVRIGSRAPGRVHPAEGGGLVPQDHLGRVPRYDTSKIRTDLGMTFNAIPQAILEIRPDLARWGHLARR